MRETLLVCRGCESAPSERMSIEHLKDHEKRFLGVQDCLNTTRYSRNPPDAASQTPSQQTQRIIPVCVPGQVNMVPRACPSLPPSERVKRGRVNRVATCSVWQVSVRVGTEDTEGPVEPGGVYASTFPAIQLSVPSETKHTEDAATTVHLTSESRTFPHARHVLLRAAGLVAMILQVIALARYRGYSRSGRGPRLSPRKLHCAPRTVRPVAYLKVLHSHLDTINTPL